jgi:hypothetical protein
MAFGPENPYRPSNPKRKMGPKSWLFLVINSCFLNNIDEIKKIDEIV